MAFFFPMMFLSGAAMPRQIMPENIIAISDLLPLTHVVTFLQKVWIGGHLFNQPVQLLWLAAMLVLGTAASVRWFRWE